MEPHEFIYESHNKMLLEVHGFFGKGIAFYLAINAALFGYVFKANLEPSIQSNILKVGLLTSVLWIIVSAAYWRWALKVGETIKKSLKLSNSETYEGLRIENNFKLGIRLFSTFQVCQLLISASLVAGYIYLIVGSC